jgi:hypothetical protein
LLNVVKSELRLCLSFCLKGITLCPFNHSTTRNNMKTLSRNLTAGALAIATVSVSAFSMAPKANAIGFINGTGTAVGNAANEIHTDGTPFSLSTNPTIGFPGSGDFAGLTFLQPGTLSALSFASPVTVIPGQAWNYSVTSNPVAFTTGGFTFKWLNPSPKTFSLDNGSPTLPFSGSIQSGSIPVIISAAGFLDTLGTLSYAYTYSQSLPGSVAPSGSKTISFTALGKPASVPEPSAVLGLLGVAGIAAFARRRQG